MSKYRVRNWAVFQHFKDRNPPWVKLYRSILDDPDWHDLDGDVAKFLVMLWLIASEDKTQNGQLPDTRTLAFRLRLKESQVNSYLSKLSHWLEQDDIKMISGRYQVDAPETETETETEERRGESASLCESPKTKGCRLPADWKLPQEWGDWAETQGMASEDIVKEGHKFRDYWHAKAGKDAVKVDWQATWRNWIRRRLES